MTEKKKKLFSFFNQLPLERSCLVELKYRDADAMETVGDCGYLAPM